MPVKVFQKGVRSEKDHIVAVEAEVNGEQQDIIIGNRAAVLDLIHGLVSALEKIEEFDSQNGGM